MKLMMWTPSSAAVFLVIVLHVPSSIASKYEKILLSSVQTLTLRSGLETSHRRVPAIPQLSCTGGGACHLYVPSTIRCQNAGHDYSQESVQWTCTASLPPEFKLGSTDVVCEGFDSPDDQFILKGSCGVEYRLLLTEIGEQKYGQPADSRWGHSHSDLGNGWKPGSSQGDRIKVARILFSALFLGVLFLILRAAYLRYTGRIPSPRRTPRNTRRPNYEGGWRRGGDGYDDDDDDPPPPYDWHSKPYTSNSSNSRPRQEHWRPGFWSGLGTGAAAGYAAGSMASRGRERQSGARSGGAGSYGAGPSSGRYASGSESGSGPTYSSNRYESSGFGSTSRR